MTVTVLDPTTALLLIDLQRGILSSPTVHPTEGVVANAAALAHAFRRSGLPVVLVTVGGGAPGRTEQARPSRGQMPPEWAELVEELEPQQGDHLVTKHTWGAFTGTGLHDRLTKLGVTQVVIGGVATSIGVESTARQAHELGLHVTLAVDAMTDRDAGSHTHSVTRIFPRLGETGTTDEIIAVLDARA
jgi:nicotinamidase-related amidase